MIVRKSSFLTIFPPLSWSQNTKALPAATVLSSGDCMVHPSPHIVLKLQLMLLVIEDIFFPNIFFTILHGGDIVLASTWLSSSDLEQV